MILLRNISNHLVYGSKGTVHSLSDDKIDVNFNGVLRNIERCVFERSNTRANKIRATRLQYPLKLAFALTENKAQEQTEPILEVDCFFLFFFLCSGSARVAVGRAVSINNLRVRNYKIVSICHMYTITLTLATRTQISS